MNKLRQIDPEDLQSLNTCLLLTACFVIPVITIFTFSLGGAYTWFCEMLCLCSWGMLFWWTGKQPDNGLDFEGVAINDESGQTKATSIDSVV
ncbi:MAG: hypothetical protein P4N59_10580 [Negativicutes bacterium]|nr:hypothetical protein [Negativicutes bacterium]